MRQFGIFFWRVTAAHVITYFIAGIFAYNFLHYQELFETPPFSSFMKSMDSPAIAAGPALQVFRGLIMAAALWWFRSVFLNTQYGWLKLWGLFLGLAILSPTAAAPGSVEGFIYTIIPIEKQIVGYLEVMPQTLLFSLIVYYWYKKPGKAWNVLSAILVAIILMLSTLAVFMSGA